MLIDMTDQITMERKALERLISALLNEDPDIPRLEALENAVALSMIALEGDGDFDEDDHQYLMDNLLSLAIQTLASKMESEGALVFTGTYSEGKDDPTPAHFVVTRDEILSAMIDHSIDQIVKNTEVN